MSSHKSKSAIKQANRTKTNPVLAATPVNLDGRLSLSTQECCQVLGISVRTLHDWRKEGIVHAFKNKQTILYPVDELKRLLNSRTR